MFFQVLQDFISDLFSRFVLVVDEFLRCKSGRRGNRGYDLGDFRFNQRRY